MTLTRVNRHTKPHIKQNKTIVYMIYGEFLVENLLFKAEKQP